MGKEMNLELKDQGETYQNYHISTDKKSRSIQKTNFNSNV